MSHQHALQNLERLLAQLLFQHVGVAEELRAQVILGQRIEDVARGREREPVAPAVREGDRDLQRVRMEFRDLARAPAAGVVDEAASTEAEEALEGEPGLPRVAQALDEARDLGVFREPRFLAPRLLDLLVEERSEFARGGTRGHDEAE